MLRRYSKARSIASASIQGDIAQSPRAPSVDAYEKRLQELTKTVELSQRKADCVSWLILLFPSPIMG